MAGCLDHCRMPEWEWLDNVKEKRNSIASVAAGVLFAAGWWIIADAAAGFPDSDDFPKACHTCGVLSTLGLVMVNSVSNSQIRGDTSEEGCLGYIGARIWLFAGFLISFGSLIASSWILFDLYVVRLESKPDYPGIATFLQNTMIFFSCIIFKFGRTEEMWE